MALVIDIEPTSKLIDLRGCIDSTCVSTWIISKHQINLCFRSLPYSCLTRCHQFLDNDNFKMADRWFFLFACVRYRPNWALTSTLNVELGAFDRDIWHMGIYWWIRNFASVWSIWSSLQASVTLQNRSCNDDVYQFYLRSNRLLYPPARRQDETHTERISCICPPLRG